MQGLDFKFDPLTGDLIDSPDGGFEQTDTSETAVLLQITQHYNEWWCDPEAGSTLHDLRAHQFDPETSLRDEAERCLGVLADRGRISDVEVQVEPGGYGRVNVATRSRDAGTGQLLDVPIRAGG